MNHENDMTINHRKTVNTTATGETHGSPVSWTGSNVCGTSRESDECKLICLTCHGWGVAQLKIDPSQLTF